MKKLINPFKPQPRKFSEPALKKAFKEFSIEEIEHYNVLDTNFPEIKFYLIHGKDRSQITITFPKEEFLSQYGLQLRRFIESLPLCINCVETWYEFDINYNQNRGWKQVKLKLYKNGVEHDLPQR